MLKYTTVVSLLQPPPEVFELFDDVLIMAPGQPHSLPAHLLGGFLCRHPVCVAVLIQGATSSTTARSGMFASTLRRSSGFGAPTASTLPTSSSTSAPTMPRSDPAPSVCTEHRAEG
eukprot:2573159-Rhodomonas_salina.1